MQYDSILDFLENINKGTFGITLEAITEPRMNKRGNPFIGRVKKVTLFHNVALGYKYENVVNNRLERQGFERVFETEKPKGKTFINDFILSNDNDANVKYLRCTMRKNTKSNVVYLVDGIEASKEILEEIKQFFPKVSTSHKQEMCGLSEENQVVVRDFKLENIITLKQGEKEFSKTSISISF